ncbi:hypothetical protein BHM03_00047471 [Ensete ventricosum]|nr:hypothetical protein BHM03_00047471 [Ensete ventricosum]
MRLYRVESFYAFLLHFLSKVSEEEGRPAPMQGRPPTARPRPRPARKRRSPAGAVARRGGACGHSELQPARKGGNRPQRDARKVVGCRATRTSGGRQRPTRKGLPPAARPQGAVARGVPARGRLPATSPQGAATHGQPCRLRRGSGDAGA